MDRALYIYPTQAVQLANLLETSGYDIKCLDERDSNASCLDDFDRTLQKSSYLLLAIENELWLFHPSKGNPLKSVNPGQWKFISELEKGELRSELEKNYLNAGLRALSSPPSVRFNLKKYSVHRSAKVVFNLSEFIFLSDEEPFIWTIISAADNVSDKQFKKELTDIDNLLINNNLMSSVSFASLYEKLGYDSPAYQAKPVINITTDEKIVDTLKKLAKVSIETARVNEAGIIEDIDTEFLHDYRVNLRKARSVISLFKKVLSTEQRINLKQELAEIMRETNRLRDLDVYLLEKEHLSGLLPENLQAGMEQMFTIFAQQRNLEYKKVSRRLKTAAYQKKISDVQALIHDGKLETGAHAEKNSLKYATKLIHKNYDKVCLIAREIDNNSADEEVHQLRIQCKKLRYLMEFFISLYPSHIINDLIKSLKKLQDILGRFNDYSVQKTSLRKFALEFSVKNSNDTVIEMVLSIGALIYILEDKQRQAKMEIHCGFEHFDSARVKNEFARLFSYK